MKVPHHIGIIPDGNRRWAKDHSMEKHCGYKEGLTPGVRLFELCSENKIEEVTFYGFTTDNLKRPPIQVEAFKQACCKAVELISKNGASLLVLGNYESPHFPQELKKYSTRQDIGGGGIKLNFL
ncbi:MAG: undecaprenyl diphosphate synthase family protein, partial [Oscillospiraceae bacterium]